MKYFGSILSVSNISPRNAHGWGLNLKKNSPISKVIDLVGVPHVGARLRNRMVLRTLKSKKKIKSIIDVGGGIGLTGFYLHQFGYEYFGLDKSGYKIKIARRLLKESRFGGIDFIHADIFGKVNISKRFDCALSMEVLEHVKKPGEMLKRISKFIKNGGYLILTFPSTHKLNDLSQEYFGHVRIGYEPADIESLIKNTDLKIEKVRSFGNGALAKLGFYVDYFLIKDSPVLAGLFFWLFYPLAVLDEKFVKSRFPLGYLIVLKKGK